MFLVQVVDANLNGHIYAILTSMYKLLKSYGKNNEFSK